MSVLRAPVLTKRMMERLTWGKNVEWRNTDSATHSADGTQYDVSNANDEDTNSEDFDVHPQDSDFRFAAGGGPPVLSRESAVSSDCDDDTQAQLRNTDEAAVRSDVEHEITTPANQRNRKRPTRFDD